MGRKIIKDKVRLELNLDKRGRIQPDLSPVRGLCDGIWKNKIAEGRNQQGIDVESLVADLPSL